MAHASKRTRTTRRSKQFASRARLTQLTTHAQRLGAENDHLLGMAITEHDKAAHLAKILAFVIAANGGTLKVTKANLEALPATTALQSMYDAETQTFSFVTTMVSDTDDAPAAPQIEVVQPKIEVVSA